MTKKGLTEVCLNPKNDTSILNIFQLSKILEFYNGFLRVFNSNLRKFLKQLEQIKKPIASYPNNLKIFP